MCCSIALDAKLNDATFLLPQIPSFFLCTLSYAMWFTFARIGEENINPTSWPLIWFVFVLVVLLNPFKILYRDSRYWFLKSVPSLLSLNSFSSY